MESTSPSWTDTLPTANWRAWALKGSIALSRVSVLFLFIFLSAGNITNCLLMKYGFEDQAVHAIKHATFIELMDGTAARPFVFRSLTARLDYWAAREIVQKWPSLTKSADDIHLHRYFFADVPDSEWTPVVAAAYTLMYFAIVGSTALGLFFVWRIARYRGLSYMKALAFLCAFSFTFPLFFQRSVLFYDFIEFAGVFGAVYFFLEGWMLPCTAFIALFSFVKETFFLVPIGLFFLHKDDAPLKKRILWLGSQLALCLFSRHFIMHGFEHNPGGTVEFHLWDNIAFWVSPRYYLDLNNLTGPGIFLPRIENPVFLIPIVIFSLRAWQMSEKRWRTYFLAAFLPLLALFIPFGYADMFRNFSLAFPAMVLISLSAAGNLDRIFEYHAPHQASSPLSE